MELIVTSVLTFIGTSILWGFNMWWSLKKVRAEANKSVLELEEFKNKQAKKLIMKLIIKMLHEFTLSKNPNEQIYINDSKMLKELFNREYEYEDKNIDFDEIYNELIKENYIKYNQDFGGYYV